MFIGRTKEIQILREANWRDQSELIVIYGRRRVGKTALIEQAFSDRPLWKFDGIEGEGIRVQLAAVVERLNRYARTDYAARDIPTWNHFFAVLADAIDAHSVTPFAICFDEFQWLAEMKHTLVALFKAAWDDRLARHPHLKMILCGSVSSFMVRRVIRSKALYGRVTQELPVLPLGIRDVRAFFQGSRPDREILEIGMTIGGVPKYLEQLNPGLSFVQNIHQQAFRRSGFFFKEYDRIFISHFGKTSHYESVVHALSGDRYLSAEDLARRCEVKSGGAFSTILEDLTLAGFIERYTPIDRVPDRSKSVRYRLADEYLRFYRFLVAPYRREIEDGSIEPEQLIDRGRYLQWRGLAFERLCLRHHRSIAETLQFAGIRYKVGSWFARRAGEIPGGQVDLVFDRADQVLTVCEMKFVDTIDGRPLVAGFDQKVSALQAHYPRHAIQRVLVLGMKAGIPPVVQKAFDRILYAEEVFFSGAG